MSDENNVIIIPENIRELYAESIKDDASRSISDLDNLVTSKVKSVSFLKWCKSNIISEKILSSEFLNFINLFWPAIKERVTFTEINGILDCLYSTSQQYDQEYDYGDNSHSNALIDILDKYEITDKAKIIDARKKRETKFEVYFNLIDSIYDKYCSKVIGSDQKIEHKKIKLVYQVLYWASIRANRKGFRLKSFLNFIDKNLAVCNEIGTKLPVLDQNDIFYTSEALTRVMLECGDDVFSGNEVARIFNLLNKCYEILCTKVENISKLGAAHTEEIYSVVSVLDVAIKKGNVEKIQTEAVFALASSVWKMLCGSETNRNTRDLTYGILNLITNLLRKKNKSIDNANEKLKQIGYAYITDKNCLEQIDKELSHVFFLFMADHSKLISEIYEIYFGSKLREGIDNAAPAVIHSENDDNRLNRNNSDINKDDENNNDISNNLNYYSDVKINNENMEVNHNEVDQNNDSIVKLHEEKFEETLPVASKNNSGLILDAHNNDICDDRRLNIINMSNNKNKIGDDNEDMLKNSGDDNNKNVEVEDDIINNSIDPRVILGNNISDNKNLHKNEINDDNDYNEKNIVDPQINGIDDDKNRNQGKVNNNVNVLPVTQKINLDGQFKHTAIYWFNLFSIVFKLISFAFLVVTLLSLISLLPQLAPVFAPVLESLIIKLVLLCSALIITLVTWKLSKTLKSKIPYDNKDKDKRITENEFEQTYVIDKSYIIDESKEIPPILGKIGNREMEGKRK